MESRIDFDLNKKMQSSFFKANTYEVRINGNSIGQIDNQRTIISENLLVGKYSIEVGEDDFFIRKEVILSFGQMQTITVNPRLAFSILRGGLIIIAVVAIIIQFLILDKISIPLMFIPLIPLLIFRKKDYGEPFTLMISETQLQQN